MVLFVPCRQQAVPVHLVNLQGQEHVLPQHLLDVVLAALVALWHHKAHQVLVELLVHVDRAEFLALDQLEHVKPRLQDRTLRIQFHSRVSLLVLAQKAIERLVDAGLELDFALELLDELRVGICLDLAFDFLVQLVELLVG